jgi:hypothetical protein
MREVLEFRIVEKWADLLLTPDQGVLLCDSVRKLEVESSDPLAAEVCRLRREMLKHGEYFFHGWDIRRYYTEAELAAAELLRLVRMATFEPSAEECGEVYDESPACPLCGAGRRQVSDLIFDLRRIPKGKDIAVSIADEVVVSERVVELVRREGVTGLDFRPVLHHCRPRKPPPVFFQPIPTSASLNFSPETVAGINPCELDEEGRHRCPLGHVAGLNLISEVHVQRASWDCSDYVVTRELVGHRMGVLAPHPIHFISQRFWRLVKAAGLQGFRVEVAHLH